MSQFPCLCHLHVAFLYVKCWNVQCPMSNVSVKRPADPIPPGLYSSRMAKFSLETARLQLKKIRKGKTVVLAAGTFDLLHPGHLDYFEWARRHGDVLVVCVVGDERTRRRKNTGRPIRKEQ